MKQFIIINDHDVRIHYSFKTWVYDMEDVKAMYLDRQNKKSRFWKLAALYFITFASLFPAMRYTLLYILPFILACFILYTTPAQPYDYYLVVDTIDTQARIKINPKDRLAILKDITGFLNYHFMYRTFTTMVG